MTEPSRLLAGRRGLSRPEKEAILARVLAGVAPRRRWGRRLALGAIAAAAAAGLLVVLPASPRDELTARGGGRVAGFEVTCVPAPCAAGSKLVFDLTATDGAAYFAAFASRGDTRIWYFPNAPRARSQAVPPGGGVLDTGIVLGPEHTPGDYVIEGVFSAEPLDRPAIRARIERGGAIVTRRMVVR